MERVVRFPSKLSVPASWPTLAVAGAADDFQRADSGVLGITPIGGKAWSQPGTPNAFGIRDGMLACYLSTTTSHAMFNLAAPAMFEVEAVIGAISNVPSEMGGGLSFCAGYGWFSARINSSTMGVSIWMTNAGGTPTQVGSTTPLQVKPGDVMKITVDPASGTVTGYVNGVVCAYATGLDLTVNGNRPSYVGWMTNGQSPRTALRSIAARAL